MAPGDAAELAGAFTATTYAGGTCMYREGDTLAQVHLVRRGTIELTRTVANRKTTIQVLHGGDVFGDIPVLTRTQAPFDACTTEDSVILSIPATTLFALFARRPGLAHRWLISIAGRMSGLQSRVGELLSGSLESRIASVLLHASDTDEVVISQEALAALVGAQRTSVNQALKRLETRGIIELGYRRISILDADALVGATTATAAQ
ncbi:MAG TPA: Crp/Fnr family transcriptional regulator [Acidimicrobiia bacterium]|nr:Crp/Fnr family transcriptional regulator [Acidimicrobiia bacterium]